MRVATTDARAEVEGKAVNDQLLHSIRSLVGQANMTAIDAKAKADMLATITNNMGEYVHRSYQAFDDPKWFKKIPDEVINDARSYLVSRYEEQGDDQAVAYRNAEVAIHEIVKNGTAYDSLEGFIKESKLGAKDLSTLKRRKEIAPEIRALLGEYKDPRINYAKSVTKMGRLVWNQKFLDKVRSAGEGVFLFTDETKPPAATAQIAAESSDAHAPLNGLWTFPEVDQAFRDALGKESMADWYRTVVQLNGMVKFGKTVLSPTTAMRNWQSAALFSIANGHFDWRHMTKSLSGLREYFTQQGSGAKLRYLRHLKELGVVYDAPYAGEMMRLLDDAMIDEKILAGKEKMVFSDALLLAQKFYQFGDDFWKIIGFENEKRLLVEHGGMSEADAEVEAAERIRNTYPTYSMVGKAIKSLRRFPLAGTFVSFPAEIVRTSFNIMKYAAKDMKNPKLRPLAIRRLAGMAIAGGFAYGLQELSKVWMDVDDDDEEAIRLLSPPWQRNSNLLFVDRTKKGYLKYFDLSYVDPYNYWKRPITAIMRDEPWEDKAVEVAREIFTPFLGTDMAAGAIFEILSNKKESGGAVYREHEPLPNQFADILNHIRKALQPGVFANIERTVKAIDGDVSASGKRYDVEEEILAWTGWRRSTLDPKASLYYRTFDFKEAKRQASRAFSDVANSPNKVSVDEIRAAYQLSTTIRTKAYEDMFTLVNAARNAGLSSQQIKRVLKGSGISEDDRKNLLSGKITKWVPTKASERNAAKKAGVLFGPGVKKSIESRYKVGRKIAKGQ